MIDPPQSPAPMARQMSVRSVIEAVLHRGPISRAELARITGLSKQTTSEVVRALEESGFVRVQGQTQGAVGRSALTYEMQRDVAFVAGVDLGGTKIHVAVANIVGDVVTEIVEPTDRRGGVHVVGQIAAMIDRLMQEIGVPRSALRCVALGSPGVFDARSGSISIAPNIPGLDAFNVAEALEKALRCKAIIENDVNLAAKGEHWRGCGAGRQSFAFVALGTGIGMGLVVNGQIVSGAHGAAGEIAYLPIGGDPFDSRGNRFGVLETAIGSAAILDRYVGLGGAGATNVRDLFDRLKDNDAAAATTLDETARILCVALMAIRAIVDPELVVLGGSIGARVELVERVQALATRHMPAPLRIERSALGSRAAIVGAIGIALPALHDSLFGLTGLQGDFALPAAPAAAQGAV